MEGESYVPSVNCLLFLINVCTAFDNNIFWAWFFLESPNSKVLISLWKLWWYKKLKRTVLCSIYKRQFKRKWETSSVVNPQTHLESVIILDRNWSYLSELQLRHNLAYKILCCLSPTKKWVGILASTTLLLRLILNESDVLVFLVSLSRLFQRFMTDGMNEDWYNELTISDILGQCSHFCFEQGNWLISNSSTKSSRQDKHMCFGKAMMVFIFKSIFRTTFFWLLIIDWSHSQQFFNYIMATPGLITG
jgi:hypothetical protein